MRLELACIVVSVGYDDFLSLTLPLNRQHFDRLVVVTAPADTATKAVCARYSVNLVETNAFYENGATFNKGKGINSGLVSLAGHTDWIMLLDADIVLPADFREVIDRKDLQRDSLYTCDRYTCDSYDLWKCLTTHGQERFHNSHYDARNFLYVTKWDQITKALNIPVGYLQIAHRTSAWQGGYPEWFPNANWSDVEFAQRYPKEKRVWLQGMSVVHLGSPGGNHDGRGTDHEQRWNE